MKKNLSFRNIGLAALLLLSAAVSAQSTNPLLVAKAEPAKEEVTTAAPETAANRDEVTLDGLKLRNEKLYQHFTGHFKNASNISIFPSEKATVIYFMDGEIRNNVLYSNKGKLQHVVRYYTPDRLPATISRIVEHAFPDYNQSFVSEVTVDGKTAYLVTIEVPKKMKIIRVVNGDWDVYQEFDKQP